MGAIVDDRVVLVGKLAAAGIKSTLDPTAVPPVVLVGPPDVDPAGVGGWSVAYPVWVIAAPPGNAEALADLLDRTELVLRTLGPSACRPATYGATDAPAYQLTYTRDVANPDC